MAAIQRTRNTSSFGGILVAAVAAALLLGAGAGYAARTMTVPMSAPSAAGSTVQHPAVSADYELPAWVEKYVAPQEPRRFRVDEYLDSLSYSTSAPIIDNATIGFTQQ